MKFKLWKERDIAPIHMCPGDQIILTTDAYEGGKRVKLLSAPITQTRIIDKVAIGTIDGLDGFKDNALAGVFGEKE